jgi:hypothetical protein
LVKGGGTYDKIDIGRFEQSIVDLATKQLVSSPERRRGRVQWTMLLVEH